MIAQPAAVRLPVFQTVASIIHIALISAYYFLFSNLRQKEKFAIFPDITVLFNELGLLYRYCTCAYIFYYFIFLYAYFT